MNNKNNKAVRIKKTDDEVFDIITEKFSYSVQTNVDDSNKDVINWCRNEFGKEKITLTAFNTIYWYRENALWDFCYDGVHEFLCFYFANKNDAFLFKMRWIGND